MTTLLGAALSRLRQMDDAIYNEHGRARAALEAERDRRLEHAKRLLWELARQNGIEVPPR